MYSFSELETKYLAGQWLGRLATVDRRGRPQVVPTGFRLDPTDGVIAIGGHDMAATKKFRDIQANPHVAYVVDDLVSTNPWRVRGIEIRGTAEAVIEGGERLGPGFGPAWIRIVPGRVRSWGLDG